MNICKLILLLGVATTSLSAQWLSGSRFLSDASGGAFTCLEELYTNGSDAVCIKAPNSIAATYTFTLPNAQGTGALTNDGSGNLSWSPAAGSFTCDTAGNCVNLDGAQTITGNKTFSAHILFGSNNTADIGELGTGARSIYARTSIHAPRFRVEHITGGGSLGDYFDLVAPQPNLFRILNSSAGILVQYDGASSVWTLTGTAIPNGSATYDLGSSSFRWRDLWLSRDLTIGGAPKLTTGTWSGGTILQTESLAINGGSFYTRTFSGGNVDCTAGGGVSDGWLGLRTDTGGTTGSREIQVCIGGVRYVAAIN